MEALGAWLLMLGGGDVLGEWQERTLGTTEHFPRQIEPEKVWSGRKADMKASWELRVENELCPL